MSFSLNKSSLSNALNVVQSVTGRKYSRDAEPLYVVIEAIKDRVNFICHNREENNKIYTDIVKDIHVQEEIAIGCELDVILDILNLFDDNDTIEFKINKTESKILLKSTQGEVQFDCVIYKEFDTSYNEHFQNTSSSLSINKDQFLQSVNAVIECVADTSIANKTMTGLLLRISKDNNQNTAEFVGASNFRLGTTKIHINSQIDITKDIILPKKSIYAITKIIQAQKNITNVDITIASDSKIIFKLGTSVVAFETIAGEYPDYNAIMPKEFSTFIDLDQKEFSNAIKKIASLAKLDDLTKIKFHKNSATLELSNDQKHIKISHTVSKIMSTLEEEVVAQIRPSLILKSISQMSGETIRMSLQNIGDSNKITKPFTLKSLSDTNLVYLIMPVL